jgi:elongation factor G
MTEAPRCAALIGPYLSGKTTLLEALLHASGSTSRRGSVRDGNSVGDHSPEARARQMSTELNVAGASFLGDRWTILDCPGSVELLHEAQGALLVSDVAVVVVEPEVERALTISALLRFLDRHKIPHMIFINKMDNASARVRDLLAALQSVSERPLVLRQVPLRGPDSEITGYVDLVSERAYRYRPGQPSDLMPLPDGFWEQEGATRVGLIEKLADFDDTLLEQLLEEVEPPKEEIYKHLTRRSCRCFSARGRLTLEYGGCGRRCAMRRRRPGRPQSGWGSLRKASPWRRSSRPITCRIPASCRSRGSGAARSPRAWC